MEKGASFKVERVLFTLVIFSLFVYAVQTARGWPLRASIMVVIMGSIGAVLALVQFISDLRSITGASMEKKGLKFDLSAPETASRWGNLEVWLWVLGLYAGIWVIGFPTAVAVFVFAYSKFYGARWSLALTLTAITWGFLYGFFDLVIHVPWPESFLFG